MIVLLLGWNGQAQLIWDGDASNGTGIFKAIGTGNVESPSTLTAVTDATHGLVWRYHKPSGSNRCENHGIKLNGSSFVFQNNTTYYLGWSTKLTNTTNNNANFQWKSYGTHIQNFPVVLKMIDGRLHMLQRQPENQSSLIWSIPFSANTWYHITIGLHLSDELRGGWVEIWFNGVKQTFTNGTQRYACRTFDGGHVCPKWGVYGASATTMTNFVDDLKVGSSWASVQPDGVTPPLQNVALGKPATASSNDGNLPGGAVDGSTTTRWSASPIPQWLEVDLGAVYDISKTEVVAYEDRAYRFTVEAKTIAEGTYTQIVNRSTNTTPGTIAAPITDNFAATPARYVRINVSGASGYTGSWSSIIEFRVFGVTGSTWKDWVIPGVAIANGQEIRLEGSRQSGEHLRVDYISIAGAAQLLTAQKTGAGRIAAEETVSIQVFPNPVVNKQATIRYALSKADRVRVVIYNISGQEEEITNTFQQPGRYALPWNTTGKPAGIYIARIIAGNQVKSVKVAVK